MFCLFVCFIQAWFSYRFSRRPLLISSWCRKYASVNRVSIGSDNGCAYPAPSHNLTQSRVIVDWTLRNKLRWDLIKIQKFLFTKLHLKRLIFFAWYGQSDSREIIKLPRPLWNIDPHVYRSKVWDDKYFHIWLIPFTHWCLLYMCIQVSDVFYISLQWCHNDRVGVSNHQLRHCLFNRLFRRRSKKTSKLRVTGGEFTGHRWIPRTKSRWRGKCFNLMTSSCVFTFKIYKQSTWVTWSWKISRKNYIRLSMITAVAK